MPSDSQPSPRIGLAILSVVATLALFVDPIHALWITAVGGSMYVLGALDITRSIRSQGRISRDS
jgi:hypothetical protein